MATLRNDTVIRNSDGQATSAIITAANIVNHAAGKVSSSDNRSVVTTPQTIDRGTVFDFKQNSTESLSDGGSYFGQMTFRPYGTSTDWSGTLSHQLGFTDSGNMWQRSGSSTTWGAWKKILNSSNYSGYALPLSGGTLTGGLSGTTAAFSGQITNTIATGTAPFAITSTTLVSNLNVQYLNGQLGSYYAAASSLASYLPLAGGTLTGALNGTTASFSGNVRVSTISAANHGLTCVYYGGGSTPTNGYLITTNIDYSTFNMPTVIIEGYAYGNGVPIHLEIVWYAYTNSWTNLSYTNLGAWNPGTISIGTNASGKVCLHMSATIYYGRFNVRCIYDQGNAPLEGWTVSDATTAALTRVTTISKAEIVTSITGNAATATNGLTTGNYNSYAPTLTGTGASGSWGISVTGSSASCTGNAGTATTLATARTLTIGSTGKTFNGSADVSWSTTEIVGYTPAYGTAAYQTKSLDTITTPGLYQYDGAFGGTKPPDNAPNYRTIEIGSSARFSQIAMPWNSDGYYFRRYDGTSFSTWRTVLHDGNYNSYAPTLTGTGASGTWAINSQGIYAAGGAYIQTTSTGTSYGSHIQVREASGGGGNTSEIYAPALGFHWSGVVASNILMESSGRIAIRNNPGSGYENFIANAIYGTIFYDSNNASYYLDPASTSNLVGLTVANTITGSVSGNAATATTTDNINGRAFYNRDANNVLGQDSYTNNGIGYVNGVSLFSQTDGGMYASAYSTSWIHQIYGDFRTGQLAIRGKNSGTWQSWRTVLDSTNASYAWNMNQNVRTTDTCSFAAVSATTFTGALTGTASGNLTAASSLTAGNLSGTIPSGVLGNSTYYIGTTAIALNRASATQLLAGVNIDGYANYISAQTNPIGVFNVGLTRPKGASYTTTASSVTGAIKIKMPPGIPVHGMWKMTIKVYEYGSRGNGYTIECGCHLYPSTAYNRYQYAIGVDSNIALTIRYGTDGTSGCVWIGENATTWSYPQIHVTEFSNGFNNPGNPDWNAGTWGVTIGTIDNSVAVDGPYTIGLPLASTATNITAYTINQSVGSSNSPTFNAATITNDLTVNGNTYLGNAGGDTVFVNDIIRIGATDSGDASLFFGEGSVAGSDYGARWYWDSGYTFTWNTRNAGTDTALFDYLTNDTTYLNWRRNFHMQNKEINYNAQIHFNAGTRFVGQDTSILLFRSDSTSSGGIRVQDGSVTTKGYIGYWDSGGGGILNNTGNWALRYNFGGANSGGTLYGAWVVDPTLTLTNLIGAYQNTSVYNSANTLSTTPSRGIRAQSSSIQFTDSYAIAPFYTYRSTGDWPVPYGIGWGTGGESSGIFQRYASNGSSFGDMIFYTGNDGSGAFSFRRHTWEGITQLAAGSGELNTELFRVDWSGNLTMLGTLNGSANSATLYANPSNYGSWKIGGTRNGWYGIEFESGTNLMANSTEVGFYRNGNGWQMRWYLGAGYIYKGSNGGGTEATILDSSNQAYAWNMNQNVRTTDTPTFAGVYTNLIGINDGGMDCYMEVTDANPTFNYETYGGEFLFYGDKSRPSSLLYVGGIDVSRTIIANAISSRDYTRQLFPGGGYYHEGGSVTGAIKIRLPVNTKSVYPMLSFTCHIYNYSTGTSRTFKIGGHYSGAAWYNPFAYCLSDNVGNLNVRWGYEGTYLCVWIGETNTGWSYPCAFITDFQNGYGAIDGIWMTGWSVTRVTAFDTVTNGPYSPGYFWNQNNDGAGSGLDADLLDGYNSATAGTANTIVLRDSSGHIIGQYILGSYFNASAGNGENPTIGQIWTQNTTDNYLRKSTPAWFRSQVTDGSYPSLTGANASGTWSISITGNAGTATSATSATSATTATGLNSSNYISRIGSSGNYNTDFQNTPAGTVRHQGDDYAMTNSPGGTGWWFVDNYRHSNNSNYWGTQVAWGWEDQLNKLATRNISNGAFGSWVYYLNSSNAAYAYNMNQYVRTTDSPTFASLLITSEISISKNNPRNLLIQGSGGADSGLLGRGSSGQFAFQVYGAGDGQYGFLDGAWAGWDIRKVADGNLFLNDNNTYYLNPGSLTNLLSLTVANTISGSITGNAGGSSASCTGNAASASSLANFTNQSGARYTTDFNSIVTTGFFNAEGTPTNSPGGSYGQLISAKGIDTGLQIYGGYTNDNLWFRGWHTSGGTFTAWRKLLHDGNYNSYAPTLTGTGASGTWTINVTGNISGSSGSCSGNAATATTLQTARLIGGVSFNGSADITLPGVNSGGNQNTSGSSASCTGNAATATRTSSQSGYAHAGTGMVAFYNWGGTSQGTNAPDAGSYTTGISVGSHPVDQAYGFQIANNMWASGLWTRNYNSSFGSWVRLLDSSNYTSYSPTLTGTGASGSWGISVTGSSASCTGNSVTATSISGFNNPTTAATANTIVYRDSGGDIYGRYLFGSYVNSSDDTVSTNLTYIMAKFGNDYHRSATADKVAAFISGQTMNINGSSTSCSGTASYANTAGALNTNNDYTVASLTSNGFVYSGSSAGSTGAFYFNSSSHGIRRASGTNDVYCYTTTGTLYLGAGGSATTHVRVTSGGDVGIGVSPSYKLDVNGNIHATAFPTSSDIRFKKNIVPLENSLEKVKKLQGVKYEWNEFVNSVRDGYKLNVPIIGLIAQDVEKIVPEVVDLWKLSDDCQDARSIDYPRLIPVLIEAIKEQQTIIENQNQKIENLIARMSALEAK